MDFNNIMNTTEYDFLRTNERLGKRFYVTTGKRAAYF